MAINPYESPPSNVGFDGKIDNSNRTESVSDETSVRRTLRALSVMAFGDTWQLGCAFSLAGKVLILREAGDLLMPSGYTVVTLIFGATGMMVSFFSLVFLAGITQQRQPALLLAIAMQALGAIAVASFVSAVISSQSASGFLPRFGAAAFAMLLTSKAIVTLTIRGLMWHKKATELLPWGYLAVICYAMCAALTSAMSLKSIPATVSTHSVHWLIFSIGISALACHAFEVDRTKSLLNSELTSRCSPDE